MLSGQLPVLMGGAFAGGFVGGLSGFAFAMVTLAIWLHVMPPVDAVPLIVSLGLIMHLSSLTMLWGSIRLERLWPFLLGGSLGVPLGVALLRLIPSQPMRIGVGGFLIVYSSFMLRRPQLRTITAGGRLADGLVGTLGGVLGGAAGLSGVLPNIWTGLRGWSKDTRRGVYQPFNIFSNAFSLSLFGGTGLANGHLLVRLLAALPALLLGTWLGARLYRRLDEAQFYRLLLWLLLLSGLGLVGFGRG